MSKTFFHLNLIPPILAVIVGAYVVITNVSRGSDFHRGQSQVVAALAMQMKTPDLKNANQVIDGQIQNCVNQKMQEAISSGKINRSQDLLERAGFEGYVNCYTSEVQAMKTVGNPKSNDEMTKALKTLNFLKYS